MAELDRVFLLVGIGGGIFAFGLGHLGVGVEDGRVGVGDRIGLAQLAGVGEPI